MFNLQTSFGTPTTNTFNLGNVAARPSTNYGAFNLFDNSTYQGALTQPASFLYDSLTPARSNIQVSQTSFFLAMSLIAGGVYLATKRK